MLKAILLAAALLTVVPHLAPAADVAAEPARNCENQPEKDNSGTSAVTRHKVTVGGRKSAIRRRPGCCRY